MDYVNDSQMIRNNSHNIYEVLKTMENIPVKRLGNCETI